VIELVRPFPPPLHRRHAWQAGDAVTHLDGDPVEDILDLYYYCPDGEHARVTIRRADGEFCEITVPVAAVDTITSCFAPLEFRTCACRCVFCFVDQNPPGMRDGIYVKDEDYRFSFLYGNYITLTSIGKRGLQRIKTQRLSPLFVSVHATDIEVRTRMLGIKRRHDVVAQLADLVDAGIEIHTQIVLCPGWNDGPVLEQSYRELLALAPGVASVAVVPVGLTAHRQGLCALEPVTPPIARRVVQQTSGWQQKARTQTGSSFVYLSDEFYLLADANFPDAAFYDDFPQVDNAVGLTSYLEQRWRDDLAVQADAGELPTVAVTIVSSELAVEALRRCLLPLAAEAGLPPVELVAAPNEFYGRSVTVAGLLSGADLRETLHRLPDRPRRTVLLPPRAFNSDGVTLDDLQLTDLAEGVRHRVLVPPDEEGFVGFWSRLRDA